MPRRPGLRTVRTVRSALPGFTSACANQVLAAPMPKKSPARTIRLRTPLALACSSRCRAVERYRFA